MGACIYNDKNKTTPGYFDGFKESSLRFRLVCPYQAGAATASVTSTGWRASKGSFPSCHALARTGKPTPMTAATLVARDASRWAST